MGFFDFFRKKKTAEKNIMQQAKEMGIDTVQRININGTVIEYDLATIDLEKLNKELSRSKKKLKESKAKLEKWENEHSKVSEIHFKARSLEKTDPIKAIELHESIRDNSTNHFDTLGRLMILYRKTKQKELEIKTINLKINQEKTREDGRLQNVLRKFPDLKDYILECYESGADCNLPTGVINFKKNILKLEDRLKRI